MSYYRRRSFNVNAADDKWSHVFCSSCQGVKIYEGKVNRNHGCLYSAHSSSESGDLLSDQKNYFCEGIIQCFVTSFQPRVNSWVIPGDWRSQISCWGGEEQREKVLREMMSKWAKLLPQLSDDRIIREWSVRLRHKPMKPLTKVNTGSDKNLKGR